MAGMMTLSLAAPAAAGNVTAVNASMTYGSEEKESPDFRVWKTDTRISLLTERELMQQAQMSLDEWDAAVTLQKRAGLEAAFTEEKLTKADPSVRIKKDEKGIYYISENAAFDPVQTPLEAYRTVYRLVPVLGGSEDTDLRLWSVIKINDFTVYSFQQVSESQEVMGSVVKLAVKEDGNVSAVFASLDAQRTRREKQKTKDQIIKVVRTQLKKPGQNGELYPEYTERTVHAVDTMETALNLDVEGDPVPKEVLWVVYSQNCGEEEKDYPYLAHYVTLDGKYRYSLPVKEPQDEESRNGFRKQAIFEGMTADSWTGEVSGADGETRTITVPVMYQEEEGRWYLGDPERRIAVADFAEAAYGENHSLRLVGSDNNKDWDNEDLFMLYNYIRAWDFYADMGWSGPDGRGTDVVILKDMCTSNGTLYENACSIEFVENWQMFGYTGYSENENPLRLVRALDVMAHEYTHTFTATVMNRNLYENDLGAINEAMSDIMGNLVEYIVQDTEDENWILGENAETPIRSMSNPRLYAQPEYVWDVFYGAHTDNPVTINDRGGVHLNSSLLNRIAAHLCLDYGMSYEDAVSFWMMTAVGMTPKTDYVQIPDLLGWAMDASGNGSYTEALEQLVEEEYLDRTQIPEKLPLGQKVVRLELPDNSTFADDNWGLIGLQINTDTLVHAGAAMAKMIYQGIKNPEDYASLASTVNHLIDNLQLAERKLNPDEINTENPEEMLNCFTDVLIGLLNKLVVQNITWREAGTNTMSMVVNDRKTLYVLVNITEAGTKMNGAAVLVRGRWIDLQTPRMLVTSIQEAFEKDNERSTRQRLVKIAKYGVNFGVQVLDLVMDTINGRKLLEVLPEENEKTPFEIVLDTAAKAVRIVKYLTMGEEGRPSAEQYFAVPAETEYLPVKGLSYVRLS